MPAFGLAYLFREDELFTIYHGLMNYKYSLVAYNSSGEAKDITFETSKILKDQAFINLKVAPIRGVVTWAEINYEELPEKVKDIY